MDWMKWMEELCQKFARARVKIGNPASPGDPSDLGKRQTKFEDWAVMTARAFTPVGNRLEAEGYEPFRAEQVKEDPEWVISLDPTDGTAGDARSADAGVKDGLPVTAVLTVRRNVPNPTFASVKYAGIVDLRHGEIFLVGPEGAFQLLADGTREPLTCAINYNKHCPAVATEIARRANAFLRFLIPYGIYPEMYADSNSSAMVMLWALRGYCDAYLNFNLPGITGAGQRGHELGAIAVFARAMGSCAVEVKAEHVLVKTEYNLDQSDRVFVVGPLDDAPYTFDGQTSCIIGVDRKIVDHYLGLINAGLSRNITLGGTKMSVGEVLVELYDQYPSERFSLPLIPN